LCSYFMHWMKSFILMMYVVRLLLSAFKEVWRWCKVLN
jgi:hypothetical protein